MNSDTWKRCVSEAKLLLIRRDSARMKICDLALEACGEIYRGGTISNTTRVSEFAREVGILPKTLIEWISIKRHVWDNLDDHHKKFIKWSVLARAKRKLDLKNNPNPSKKEINDLFILTKKEMESPTGFYNLKRYLKHVRYVVNRNPKMKQQMLDEIEVICCDVLMMIKKKRNYDYD